MKSNEQKGVLSGALHHEKLEEFHKVLSWSLGLLSDILRPSVEIREFYEPHNGPELPVQALIIGGRWASFVQMQNGKPPRAEIRVEEIKPDLKDNPNFKREDPSEFCGGPNPYFICDMLLKTIIGDYMWPMHRAYHKKMYNLEEK